MVRNSRRAAVGAASLAFVAAACGVGLSPRTAGPDASTPAEPSTVSSAVATPDATERATPTDDPTVPPTAEWPRVESVQYGFTIGHPPGWRYRPATRDWQLEADAATFFGDAEERFKDTRAPGIAVSAWSVDPDAPIHSMRDLVDWAASYCRALGNSPCDGIRERAIPLCIGHLDCGPAIVVPFELDVYAFLPGLRDERVVVIAVWRPDAHQSASRYGGSIQLLLDMVATMGDIYPV
jgi:hypothetical protein